MSTPALATADLIERLTRSLAQAERDKASLHAQLEQVIERWRTEVVPSLAKVDELRTQLKQSQDAYASLVAQNQTLQAHVAKEAISSTRAQELYLRKQAETAQAQVEALHTRLKQSQAAHASLLTSHKGLQAYIAKADAANKSTVSQLNETNQGLFRRLVEKDNRLNRLNEMYAEAVRSLRAAYKLTSTPERVSLAPPPVYVTYALLPTIDINNLVGATTTEPYNQQMMDVFVLIKKIISPPINAPLPKGLGDTGARTITVIQDSPADIALAGFPSLVKKVS